MSNPRMKQLLVRLRDRTLANGLAWQETEAEGVYQVAFPGYAVRLSERANRDPEVGGKDYWISIYNSDGKLIDEVCDVDLRDDFQDIGTHAFPFMGELYDMARRTAMGVEEAISDILSKLG